MSRPGDSVVAVMTVCQKCGDKGDSKRLVYCVHCQISAEHSYCLDKLPTTDVEKVIWTCEDCCAKDAKPIPNPPRQSENISVKMERKVKRHRKWRLNESSILAELLMNTKLRLNERTLSAEILSNTKAEDAQVPNEKIKNPSSSCNEDSGNQELRKHRRLVLGDMNSSDEKYEVNVMTSKSAQDAPVESKCNLPSYIESVKPVPAQPVIDPIWKGGFNIENEENRELVRLVAHLSSKACSKAHDAAKALPTWLDVEILPRSVAWPPSFVRWPPMDEAIALYFFPEYERDEKVFDGLLDDIIEKDLALKALIANNVDLLVFSSLELPEEHWRIQRKYYLWGVFRRRNNSSSPP